MAATTLIFSKVGDKWVTTFTSMGESIVEMERKGQGLCSIRANIEGMKSVPVTSFKNPYESNVIFNLDIPAGVEVTIESATEVINAKMITEE